MHPYWLASSWGPPVVALSSGPLLLASSSCPPLLWRGGSGNGRHKHCHSWLHNWTGIAPPLITSLWHTMTGLHSTCVWWIQLFLADLAEKWCRCAFNGVPKEVATLDRQVGKIPLMVLVTECLLATLVVEKLAHWQGASCSTTKVTELWIVDGEWPTCLP